MNTLKNKKTVFYTLIIVVSLLIANNTNIKLNTFFAILLASFGIYHLKNSIKFKEQKEKEILEDKKNYIVPNMDLKVDINNPTLINYFFSVQDFHKFNPIAYEKFVDCTMNFYKIIELINKNQQNVYTYWNFLEKYKKCSLNNLHSITLSLPSDTNSITKLDKKILELEDILNEEMVNAYQIYKDQIKKNRNWYSKEITIGPKPYNINESNIHSFDFYI